MSTAAGLGQAVRELAEDLRVLDPEDRQELAEVLDTVITLLQMTKLAYKLSLESGNASMDGIIGSFEALHRAASPQDAKPAEG